MKKIWTALIVLCLFVLLPPVVVPFFSPWSEINCRHEEINIRTGEIRRSRKLWFFTINSSIEQSELSVLLEGEVIQINDHEPWHMVNTLDPYVRNSPHYTYHSAISQIRSLQMIWEIELNSLAERKQMAREVLTSWQLEENDQGVEDIIFRLTNKR